MTFIVKVFICTTSTDFVTDMMYNIMQTESPPTFSDKRKDVSLPVAVACVNNLTYGKNYVTVARTV
jgi:hypothetical protein